MLVKIIASNDKKKISEIMFNTRKHIEVNEGKK